MQRITVQFHPLSVQLSSVQSLSRVWLFATPWIAAPQASLSITNSRSSLKLTSIESVMPSSHLNLCRPLLLLPPIPPSIRVFANESTLHMRWPKYWSFSFSIIPSKEHHIKYTEWRKVGKKIWGNKMRWIAQTAHWVTQWQTEESLPETPGVCPPVDALQEYCALCVSPLCVVCSMCSSLGEYCVLGGALCRGTVFCV